MEAYEFGEPVPAAPPRRRGFVYCAVLFLLACLCWVILGAVGHLAYDLARFGWRIAG